MRIECRACILQNQSLLWYSCSVRLLHRISEGLVLLLEDIYQLDKLELFDFEQPIDKPKNW